MHLPKHFLKFNNMNFHTILQRLEKKHLFQVDFLWIFGY